MNVKFLIVVLILVQSIFCDIDKKEEPCRYGDKSVCGN